MKTSPLRSLVLTAAALAAFRCLGQPAAPLPASPVLPPPRPAFQLPPKTWIDPDTGHRVIRLTDETSLSFYFNVNAYTPDGKEMAYLSPAGLGVVNLTDFKTRIVVTGGQLRGAVVGHKTPRVFYVLPD